MCFDFGVQTVSTVTVSSLVYFPDHLFWRWRSRQEALSWRLIMKIVVQRTTGIELFVDGRLHSSTAEGLLILHGTMKGDSQESCAYLADKAVNLRIFEDQQGKMNLSALDRNAEIMIVSQFTLYADCRKGRRPGFDLAMAPAEAEILYQKFVELVAASGPVTKTGIFGASMDIKFTNHGPVTIIIEHAATKS